MEIPRGDQLYPDVEERVKALLAKMTLQQKIGQLQQVTYSQPALDQPTRQLILKGAVGSFLNVYSVDVINEMQLTASKSDLPIPLLVGKDVIHGFKTTFPIPLSQACSFNYELVYRASRVASREASNNGIRWTFTPMVDIARDPRWGRVAEGFGQDPFLCSRMAVAVSNGFQEATPSVIACGKHFVGYGAAEGGRDYNTTIIPQNILREVYLRPFRALVQSKCQSFMASFNQINGVPCSANPLTMKRILRQEWKFDGLLVSDYEGVVQMINHGFCKDKKECARKSISAGLDMEMVSTCYAEHLETLVKEGGVTAALIDSAVSNILRIKFRLGLFESSMTDPSLSKDVVRPEDRLLSRELALQSIVLLKNQAKFLPIPKSVKRVAVIGVLANSPWDQQGCWIPDAESKYSVTPLEYIKTYLTGVTIVYAKGVASTRDPSTAMFEEAINAAKTCDAVILVVGEDADLSGQSNSRAYLDLPGAQQQLAEQVCKVSKNVVTVVMAGRPLVLTTLMPLSKAVLYAWHLGIEAGPAIIQTIFGDSVPSGKLPITMLRTTGQVPTYYNKKSTGRPNDGTKPIPFTTGYTDEIISPLFPFGYGLSYTTFTYSSLTLSAKVMRASQTLQISCFVFNTGSFTAKETVQLYIQDLYGCITRPVKELKDFVKVEIAAGTRKQVTFSLTAESLKFFDIDSKEVLEEGDYKLFVGSNSATPQLSGQFYFQP